MKEEQKYLLTGQEEISYLHTGNPQLFSVAFKKYWFYLFPFISKIIYGVFIENCKLPHWIMVYFLTLYSQGPSTTVQLSIWLLWFKVFFVIQWDVDLTLIYGLFIQGLNPMYLIRWFIHEWNHATAIYWVPTTLPSIGPRIILFACWCNLIGYYFILNQSNHSTIDLEWVEVEKKHPFESGFKNYTWKSLSLAKLLEGVIK